MHKCVERLRWPDIIWETMAAEYVQKDLGDQWQGRQGQEHQDGRFWPACSVMSTSECSVSFLLSFHVFNGPSWWVQVLSNSQFWHRSALRNYQSFGVIPLPMLPRQSRCGRVLATTMCLTTWALEGNSCPETVGGGVNSYDFHHLTLSGNRYARNSDLRGTMMANNCGPPISSEKISGEPIHKPWHLETAIFPKGPFCEGGTGDQLCSGPWFTD